jgi:DeoR family transcriptional regulator, suf operon transcriptional repressor
MRTELDYDLGVADAPLDNLPATRRAILLALRRHGEMGVEALADALEITPSAVRQQLAPLVASALVDRREERRGPGRPTHLYRIGAAAEALFPKTYDQLAGELIGYIDAREPELVSDAFRRRGERRVEQAQERLAGRAFDERVRELTRILDEDGYLADAERRPDGTWVITEHNCAILAIARRYPHACSSEIDFLRAALPDAEIERVAHMVAGAHVCSYTVRTARAARGRRRRTVAAA